MTAMCHPMHPAKPAPSAAGRSNCLNRLRQRRACFGNAEDQDLGRPQRERNRRCLRGMVDAGKNTVMLFAPTSASSLCIVSFGP